MKRFLIILSILSLFPFMASAQLNVQGQTSKSVKLATARTGNVSLFENGDTYSIAIKSSNKFDDPAIFYLGTTKESSIATLKDMIGLFDTMEVKSVVDVKDATDKPITIVRISKPTLSLKFPGIAGDCWLMKTELQKFLESITK